MVCWLVGVAVNQGARSCINQPLGCHFRIHINKRQPQLFARLTLCAQPACNGLALFQRFAQKVRLPGLAAHHFSKLLVIRVCQAQFVAMAQQPALLVEAKHSWVPQRRSAALVQKLGAHKKIPIAVHEKDVKALGCLVQMRCALPFETAGR